MRENTYLKQTIDRVECLTFIKDFEGVVSIDVVVTNNCIAEVDLKGYKKEQFLDLRNDVRERLIEAGYPSDVDMRF